MFSNRAIRILVPTFLTLLISGMLTSCASRKAGWLFGGDKISLTSKEYKSLKKQALTSWQKRHIKEDLEMALAAFEKLSKATTDNYEYLVYLSRGYYFLADAHYDDVELKKKYWEVGTSWAEKALATNPAFAAEMKKGEKVEDHLDKLGKKEVSAMYWTAVNLGKWAKNSGIATTLKYKNRIRSLVSKVEKLNDKYFYAAAYRYWGAYYAVAPGFAGGSMPKSKKYFEKAIKLSPDYLGTKVLYAQLYMTKKEDRDGFKKLLNQVLKANPKTKEIEPENVVEKKKAQKMLEGMDDLF